MSKKRRFFSNGINTNNNPYYYYSESKPIIEDDNNKTISLRAYNELLELNNKKDGLINKLLFKNEVIIDRFSDSLFWSNVWAILGIIISNTIVAVLSWYMFSTNVLGG